MATGPRLKPKALATGPKLHGPKARQAQATGPGHKPQAQAIRPRPKALQAQGHTGPGQRIRTQVQAAGPGRRPKPQHQATGSGQRPNATATGPGHRFKPKAQAQGRAATVTARCARCTGRVNVRLWSAFARLCRSMSVAALGCALRANVDPNLPIRSYSVSFVTHGVKLSNGLSEDDCP